MTQQRPPPQEQVQEHSQSSNERHPALQLHMVAKQNKARVTRVKLPHVEYESPIYMPVGTQGTIKGLTSEQVKGLNPPVILGNTYHLGQRPGPDLLQSVGGLHEFMEWRGGGILTDSGGVSDGVVAGTGCDYRRGSEVQVSA